MADRGGDQGAYEGRPEGAGTLAAGSAEAEMQALLLRERERNRQLTATIEGLRASTAALLNTCEQAQEGISNQLLREINRLKALQLGMCDEVEAQEARLVDVLEGRLRALRLEKVALENALEQEQEQIFHMLQRQIDELRAAAGGRHGADAGPGRSVAARSRAPVEAGVCARSSLHGDLSRILLGVPADAELREQVNLAVSRHVEREAELQRQVAKLQAENQLLLVDNISLQNRLRRYSIEESPILEPHLTSSSFPPSSASHAHAHARRSDPPSSPTTAAGELHRKSGSIIDLHLARPRRSVHSECDGETNGTHAMHALHGAQDGHAQTHTLAAAPNRPC